jgi:hypothetical protein
MKEEAMTRVDDFGYRLTSSPTAVENRLQTSRVPALCDIANRIEAVLQGEAILPPGYFPVEEGGFYVDLNVDLNVKEKPPVFRIDTLKNDRKFIASKYLENGWAGVGFFTSEESGERPGLLQVVLCSTKSAVEKAKPRCSTKMTWITELTDG